MSGIAILGGTGPEGVGLALRLARSGRRVVIGSRRPERAGEKAAAVAQRLRRVGCDAAIEGRENGAAVEDAEMVFVATPYAAIESLLPALRGPLGGRIVVDVVNPLQLDGGVFRLRQTRAPSAAETIAEVLRESRVVSAFKTLSAKRLQRIERPLDGDVLVCGDDDEARGRVGEVASAMPRLRAVDCGPLESARHVEGLTVLLLNLNRRHRASTSVRILGLL
jgi:NADPH-dependent F420 reductase